MEVSDADIRSVCFGILCNFTPICGEDKAKEAVSIVRSLQAENKKLYELIDEFQKLLHAYQDVVVPDHKKRIEQLEKARDDTINTTKGGIFLSGGYWNYRNGGLASDIFGWDLSVHYGDRGFAQSAKARRLNPLEDKLISELVWDVFVLLDSFDYYKSSDTGEEDYRADVERFKSKWMKISKERTKMIVDEELESLKEELYRTFQLNDKETEVDS